jgi:hypothetical protein
MIKSRKIISWFLLILLSLDLLTCTISLAGDSNPDNTLGWERIDDGRVLCIWNQYDNYFFNISNGMQFTNHYNRYWAHNVMMVGYYTGDSWHLLYRVDELTGFNRTIDLTEEYCNVTFWKDINYTGYNFRLAMRYSLGVDDMNLTVIPYIKNLGVDIPFTLGFGWELKDIRINMVYDNNFIEINDTEYNLHQELNESYTFVNNSIFTLKTTSYYLYLNWDDTLNYLVTVKTRSGQYNAPVTLFIKVGTLGSGQEKYTSLFWYDSDYTIRPNGAGDVTQFTAYGDSSNYLCVDDVASDSDTTYVYAGSGWHYDLYDFDDPLESGSINNLTIYVVCRTSSAGTVTKKTIVGFKLAGTEYWGSEQSITSSYVAYSQSWTTNPATSAAWTWENITNMQIGHKGYVSGNQYRCTQIYATIDYTPVISVTTNTSTGVEENNATLNGYIGEDGGSNISAFFQYGLTTSYGSSTSKQYPKSENQSFSANVTGLSPGTTYHYRAVANSSSDYSYFLPCANGTYTEMTPDGDNPNYNCVDDLIGEQDGVITEVFTGETKKDTYNIDNHTGETGIIDEICVYAAIDNDTEEGEAYAYIMIRTNGNDYYGDNITALVYCAGDFTIFSYTWSANPYTGATWTWSEIDNLEIGLLGIGIDGSIELTQIYVQVNYSTNYSYGDDMTFTTKPEAPTGLTAVSSNDSILLSWTKGLGAANTYIERNTSSTWSWGEGTNIYNSTGSSYSDTGLSLGTTYYYQSWGFNNSIFSDNITSVNNVTYPGPPTSLAGTIYGTYLNITWTNGSGADTTLIRKKSGSYPTGVTDGTQCQNNTLSYWNETAVEGMYYSLWSYNSTLKVYSSQVNYTFGGLYINCYDETNNTNLTFDVLITNSDGSQVYTKTNCTNTERVDITLCPQGSVSILISSVNHSSRIYYMTIYNGNWYTLNAYLPMNITEMVALYDLRVIDTANNPIENALVNIKKYSNLTGIYETISTLYTDAYGYVSIYLIYSPASFYKVFINKTGYDDVIEDYTPMPPNEWGQTEVKIFKLTPIVIPPQPPIVDLEDIHFTVTLLSNTSALVEYSDDTSGTIYALLTIEMYNYNTSSWSSIGSLNYSFQSWNYTFTDLNRSNIYFFNLTFNHNDIGVNHRQYVLDRLFIPPLTESIINDRFSWVGVIPIGISNFLMWLLLIAVMYYADERDVGKIIIILGTLFLLLNGFLGWGSGIITVFSGALPVLFIIIGVLIEWGQARKRETS